MRVYLSGPMTGRENLNREAFEAVAAVIRKAGVEVSNPAELQLGPGAGWGEYMRADVRMMMDCHAVVALTDWHESRGAGVETRLAHDLEMPVLVWRGEQTLKVLCAMSNCFGEEVQDEVANG